MLDGLTEKIREIESGGRVLYRRDYRISSEKQMPNLRSRRGEGCSLDRVQKVYAAGSILGARRPTQIEFCIGSDSSVSSRFFLGNGSGPFGTRSSRSCRPRPGQASLGTQSLISSLFSGAVPQLEFYRSHSVP